MSECRWPDERCVGPAKRGSPYCVAHHARAYRGKPKKLLRADLARAILTTTKISQDPKEARELLRIMSVKRDNRDQE